MIDKNKTYRTRCGREVRIYATDGEGQYPVHGAVKSGKTAWQRATWTREGIHCVSDSVSEFDLFECSDKGVEMIDKNKMYRTRCGQAVRIYTTNGGGDYPVHGAIYNCTGVWLPHVWTIDGVFNLRDRHHAADLVEYDALSELKIDDRILVRNNDGDRWRRRHFARVGDNGKVMTFDEGQTSWSTECGIWMEWNQWKLPEGDNSFREQQKSEAPPASVENTPTDQAPGKPAARVANTPTDQASGTSDGIWNTLRESNNRWW